MATIYNPTREIAAIREIHARANAHGNTAYATCQVNLGAVLQALDQEHERSERQAARMQQTIDELRQEIDALTKAKRGGGRYA